MCAHGWRELHVQTCPLPLLLHLCLRLCPEFRAAGRAAAEEATATGRKTDAPGAPSEAGRSSRVFTQQTLMKHFKVPSVVPGSEDSQRNKAWAFVLVGEEGK